MNISYYKPCLLLVSLQSVTLYTTATWIPFKNPLLWLIQHVNPCCILLPLTMPCCTTWQITHSLISFIYCIASCSLIGQNYIMWHWIIWLIINHNTFWGVRVLSFDLGQMIVHPYHVIVLVNFYESLFFKRAQQRYFKLDSWGWA